MTKFKRVKFLILLLGIIRKSPRDGTSSQWKEENRKYTEEWGG